MQSWDIIVIGSGISGLNFALRAAEKGSRVLVITKKRIAQSSTNFAQGGIAAVLSNLDDFQKHVQDTLTAGCFHNNKRAVEYLVKHGPTAITRLVELGVPFATHDGKLLLTREGGHSERRIAFVSDYTGQAIEKVLVGKVRKNPHITLMEHTFAAELLVKQKRCYGGQIFQGNTSKNVFGNITVLATGGIGQLYENTTNPEISTGDGIAMAARASCRFRDLEFVQFHPTALKIKGKPRFLISEAVRGEGAYLRNVDGKRFMKRYHHLAELAPRDVVSRAIFEEEKKGPVYLELRHKNPEEVENRFPQIYQKLKSYGINMAKDLIPISPAAHYLCGGIRVNLRGETGIHNLYAFGETTGTGVHGANRLASNSLLEALVFSDRILEMPHRGNKKTPHFHVPKSKKLSGKQLKTIASLRKRLRHLMWENVGIVRTKKNLTKALEEIERLIRMLREIPQKNHETLELRNMLCAGHLITQAALKRRKSLGCHFRKD